MKPLRQQMLEEMQLHGLSTGTQDCYISAVRRLAAHYLKPPDELSDEELRNYFLYLMNEKQLSSSSCRVAHYAIRFLYVQTLKRPWPPDLVVRPAKATKLPVVLSIGEVQQILGCIRKPHYRVCLSTIYACGLRRGEGVSLQVTDIDSERMVLHVRQGKGAKDRHVPLPESTLEMLRSHWTTHRHPLWLFPAKPRDGQPWATATAPMSPEQPAKGHAGCGARERHPEACDCAYLAPFLCNTPAGSRRQSASDSSLSGPQFHRDHRSLPPPDTTDGNGRR